MLCSLRRVVFAWNPQACFALDYLGGVERLIHASWYYQGRHPGPQALRDGPDAPMMNYGGASGKYFRKGCKGEL